MKMIYKLLSQSIYRDFVGVKQGGMEAVMNWESFKFDYRFDSEGLLLHIVHVEA
jgi:hypothetical protein